MKRNLKLERSPNWVRRTLKVLNLLGLIFWISCWHRGIWKSTLNLALCKCVDCPHLSRFEAVKQASVNLSSTNPPALPPMAKYN